MDLNINELPEREKRVEPAMPPPPRDGSIPIKVGGFLAIVVVLTALAINSHQGSPDTMASDTPPPIEGVSTLPPAPSARTTTGSASPATRVPNPAATSR